MNKQKRLHYVVLSGLILLLSGCSSLLPRSRSESSAFASFDEARGAIDGLVPGQSDLATLQRLGLDPVSLPNTTILSYPDILRRFVTGSVLSKDDLDPGIVTCLQVRDACRGWEINVARIAKKRTGNFLADFTNFSRRTETTGWRFNALILLANDVVVYRAWGGQPVVNELEHNTNPLGPLQNISPGSLVGR